MNQNDFYKLKYQKYKNKYLELKQKNLLDQQGGLAPSGRFLFFIPYQYFFSKNSYDVDGKLSFLKDEKGNIGIYTKHEGIIAKGTIHTKKKLSYADLCAMSVLVIPYTEDKQNISSTKEWYIPQIIENSVVPLKWDNSKINIEKKIFENQSLKNQFLFLFCIARDFLSKNNQTINEKFKEKGNVNIDELEFLCLEFDISKVFFNTYKTDEILDTFTVYKKKIENYLENLNQYKATIDETFNKANCQLMEVYNKRKQFDKASPNLKELSEEQKTVRQELTDRISRLEFEIIKPLESLKEFERNNFEFLKKYKQNLEWFLDLKIDVLTKFTPV